MALNNPSLIFIHRYKLNYPLIRQEIGRVWGKYKDIDMPPAHH